MLFFNLVSRFQEVQAPLSCWQIALGKTRPGRAGPKKMNKKIRRYEKNNIFNCRLSVEYMSKSRYWWKMSKWRKTGSRNDHKEMFQTMKRERTIYLEIKSEEDICTSWEIIFEIFEILYLYEILHLNIWILKVKRMSAHHETLILRYFQLVPARRSN